MGEQQHPDRLHQTRHPEEQRSVFFKSFIHVREISMHKMHHVRREAKLARLEEED